MTLKEPIGRSIFQVYKMYLPLINHYFLFISLKLPFSPCSHIPFHCWLACTSSLSIYIFFLLLKFFIFILFFYFTILYWFCHTVTWIRHGCTYVPHLSGSFQCTSPEHPVSCIESGLAICFIYDNLHVSIPFSHIIPPSPSPTESRRLFYTSVSLLLSCLQGISLP